MNWPGCKSELKMADRQGVEIDYCPQCRGVWLDRGELDKIIERSSVQAGGRGDSPEYRHQGPFSAAPRPEEIVLRRDVRLRIA